MECSSSVPGNISQVLEYTAADTPLQTETEPIFVVSAAVSLPPIATAESLRYLLQNVGYHDKLADYVRVMSHDIDVLIANLQYRGQCNLFLDRPAASDCAVSLHPIVSSAHYGRWNVCDPEDEDFELDATQLTKRLKHLANHFWKHRESHRYSAKKTPHNFHILLRHCYYS